MVLCVKEKDDGIEHDFQGDLKSGIMLSGFVGLLAERCLFLLIRLHINKQKYNNAL